MKNKDLIIACTNHNCDHCGCGKECDYFESTYNTLPVVVGEYISSGIDVIYGLKKVEGEPYREPVPVKLDEEWLEIEVMENDQ